MHVVHTFTDVISLLVGIRLYQYLSVKNNTRHYDVWYVIFGALGALFFSKILAALENPFLFINPPSLLYYVSNKTIIGGVAGGIIGVELYKYLKGIRFNTGDSTVLPLAVGIIIGRIGCQLLGVSDGTIGIPCTYLWCLHAGDTYTRHPLPLYEVAFLLVFILISYKWIINQTYKSGFVFRLFIVGYFGLRFLLEFLKDINPIFLNLSGIQITCLSFVIYYIFDIIHQALYLPDSRT